MMMGSRSVAMSASRSFNDMMSYLHSLVLPSASLKPAHNWAPELGVDLMSFMLLACNDYSSEQHSLACQQQLQYSGSEVQQQRMAGARVRADGLGDHYGCGSRLHSRKEGASLSLHVVQAG